MRILQLCNKMVFPARDGYALAVLNLSKAFAARGDEAELLCMNTSRHYVNEQQVPSSVQHTIPLHAVKVNNNISAAGAFVKLLQNQSYNVSRFVSKKFEEKLSQLLAERKPDVVQLEGLYLTPYIDTIRKHSSAKIALRAHNVEHLVWQRNSEQEKNFAKKVYLKILTKQLRSYERAVLDRIDLLVPVSEIDAEHFQTMGNKKPVHVCPVSYNDMEVSAEDAAPERDTVFFIGSMDWLPNEEGLRWFLAEVWNVLHDRFPGLKFYIAGRKIPPAIRNDRQKNIFVVGEVENGLAFMRTKELMIVPLFAGSGMRVKIVEGLSAGKTIISTTIGAEGIACTKNEQILVADTAAEFIEAVSKCIRDRSFAEQVGRRAQAFAKEHYSASATAQKLAEFYQKNI